MKSIQLKQTNSLQSSKTTETKTNIIKKYLDFAEAQGPQKVFWYLKAIIIIPTVFMVPSIMVMYFYSNIYVVYVGLCMMLFFTNLVLHLAEAGGRTFVPFYHITLSLMVLFPSIAYLLS